MNQRISLNSVREEPARAFSPNNNNDDYNSGGNSADDEFLGDTLVEGHSRRQHESLTP